MSVTAPKFKMPPPSPSARPLLRVTELRVRLPVLLTSAMRKGSVRRVLERVMVLLLPAREMTVVMMGSPSGPCVPEPLLVVRL